ncbi:MAG: universal stress protein, partial [Rhizobiales bacterium]|nr:universal stress protein [Hyphomicrobiales bacterium]
MYKKILVPIDLGDVAHGEAILRIAENLADDDARIVLLNVFEEIPAYVAAELPSDIGENLEEQSRSQLMKIAASCPKKTDIIVRRGSAASAIVSAAEDLDIDLIIIASHQPGLA